MDTALEKLLQLSQAPMSMRDAIRAGYMVPCSQESTWSGFAAAGVMSAAAWDEIVGSVRLRSLDALPPDKRARRELARSCLQDAWNKAMEVTRAYRAKGVVLPAIHFRARALDRRQLALTLTAVIDNGTPYVVIRLAGEA